jgi:hypothetical protein
MAANKTDVDRLEFVFNLDDKSVLVVTEHVTLRLLPLWEEEALVSSRLWVCVECMVQIHWRRWDLA